MAPKMEPKSKKNGIENKSDFKTKLYGGMSMIRPSNVAVEPPLAHPHTRAR